MGNWQTTALGLAAAALLTACAVEASAQILSSKRGFADVGANYNNLQATGAGWYYTWGTGAANPGNFDAKHIPMFWNGTPSQNTINNIKNRPGVEYVLGFNEPERPDQANMTVAQAIASWTTISNGFAGSNIKLVGPAVADTGGAAGGQAWLASFMSQAATANLRVDAVAFHWYGVSTPNNPAGAASSFLSRVQSYYNQYNKPVFITEFAIHDWGGAYSDAEIVEANRQFLNIVIPELESRSYVAGYAWYHWFSDAHLYEGNPAAPTPMSHRYVGAVTSGNVANIGGQNLGEHVAYLAGGELTMTGTTPGTIRYINALSGASSISGTMDWGLTGANWVRVQPGATLRKTGANQITFSGGSITNNGALEVAQGSMRLGALVAGNGNAVVKGGTLALVGAGRLNSAPLIDVRAGGTFDVTGMNAPFTIAGGRALNIERNGTVVGNVTAALATISGGGTFQGNLSAQTAAVVRVGKDGLGVATRFVVDNFESYGLGNVRTVASPPWTAHQDTTLADVENFAGNNVLTYGFATDFRGTSRMLPEAAVLDNNETATIFFRVNSKTDDPDHNFGLGDTATVGATNFGDFEAQVRLKQGTSAGTFAVDARNGGGFSATLANGLPLNTWHNVWMVVNQATDAYDVYMNTGAGAATAANKLNATPLAFRNGTAGALNTLLALAGPAPIDNGVRIDDIVFQTGVDLSNPMVNFDPGLVWTAETLTVNGDYTQTSLAALEMNLFDPANHDVLAVTGHASLGGALKVTLAVGAPEPELGDVFDVLDFGSAGNAFDALFLPTLSDGLIWKTSNLLITGALEVVAALPGDFDQNGVVDGEDFLAWQRGESPNPLGESDLADWQQRFGEAVAAAQAVSSVPEPRSLALLATATLLVCHWRVASGKRVHGLLL